MYFQESFLNIVGQLYLLLKVSGLRTHEHVLGPSCLMLLTPQEHALCPVCLFSLTVRSARRAEGLLTFCSYSCCEG